MIIQIHFNEAAPLREIPEHSCYFRKVSFRLDDFVPFPAGLFLDLFPVSAKQPNRYPVSYKIINLLIEFIHMREIQFLREDMRDAVVPKELEVFTGKIVGVPAFSRKRLRVSGLPQTFPYWYRQNGAIRSSMYFYSRTTIQGMRRIASLATVCEAAVG